MARTETATHEPRGERIIVEDAATRGKTFLSDGVISTVARIAAENVEGVYKVGIPGLRGIVSRLGGKDGIESEVGMKEAAVTIDCSVHYGYPIKALTERMREEVIAAVERICGRKVVAVDINVDDIHLEKATKGRELE